MKKLEDRFDNKPEATQEIETREKKEVDAPVNVKSKISPVAPVLPPFQSREDRVGRYFKKHLKNFLFDEFSDSFLSRQKNLDFMRGVPIPLRHEDYQLFNGGEGLKILHIAENMAWVMALTPNLNTRLNMWNL